MLTAATAHLTIADMNSGRLMLSLTHTVLYNSHVCACNGFKQTNKQTKAASRVTALNSESALRPCGSGLCSALLLMTVKKRPVFVHPAPALSLQQPKLSSYFFFLTLIVPHILVLYHHSILLFDPPMA